MTVLFNNRQTDGDSASHTIATDITTVTARGNPWGRCRLVALIETAVGSGEYVAVPDWEMTAPGSRNVVTNSAAGLTLKTRLLGAALGDVPQISVDAS